MMLNSGWQSNKGLGPQGKESGKLYPVRTELKRDRHGLDFKKNDKKVTHFQAFDVNSVKKPKNDDEKCLKPKIRLFGMSPIHFGHHEAILFVIYNAGFAV